MPARRDARGIPPPVAQPEAEAAPDAPACSAGQTGGATLGDVMRGRREALKKKA
jgi:hypothetical protein